MMSNYYEFKYHFRSISQTTLKPLSASNPHGLYTAHWLNDKNSRWSSQKRRLSKMSISTLLLLNCFTMKWNKRTDEIKKRLRSDHRYRPLWLWTLESTWHSAPSPTFPCCVCVMLQFHYFCSCMWAEDGVAAWWEDGRGVAAWDILEQTGNVVCCLMILSWLEISVCLFKFL